MTKVAALWGSTSRARAMLHRAPSPRYACKACRAVGTAADPMVGAGPACRTSRIPAEYSARAPYGSAGTVISFQTGGHAHQLAQERGLM